MRSLVVALACMAVAGPAMAEVSGKLTAPPEGGWQAAVDAARAARVQATAPAPAVTQRAADPETWTAKLDRERRLLGGGPAGVAVALADDQIADERGGFSGRDFNVFFAGQMEHLGNTQGHFAVGNNVPSPNVGINGGNVNIETHIGEFQGASGFFQIAQVPGDFNIINQNLFVQINMLDQGLAVPFSGF